MDINLPSSPGFPPFKKPSWGSIVFILIVAFLFSSLGTLLFTVQTDEVGVIQRFGQYVRTTNPGLHFKLPFGIETVRKVKVTHVFKEEFGFRTLQAGVRSTFLRDGTDTFEQRRYGEEAKLLEQESLMLTGDLNVADVEWIVQYRVKDPVLYSFKVRNVRETLRNMSEAIMNLVVGDNSINEVLTIGREKISHLVQMKLQEILEGYQAGILITNVVLQDVTPPDPVRPSFNEVNEAKQEKEKAINQAWEDYNRTIPKARGEADKVNREAEGYALDRVNRARGDAEKFIRIWSAYKEAKEVTRVRLYLEAMQKVWPLATKKYVIDEDVKGVLPLMDLTRDLPKEEGGRP